MRKAFTVIMISTASVAAGALVGLGLLLLDAFRAYAKHQDRGTFERVKIPKSEREAFEARMQEAEFAVINRGPTVIRR